jgi:eukaryotic-like serine/threonine-protein kinase
MPPRIGLYQLDLLLGHGGMGAVWAATHRSGAPIAMKLLKAEIAAESWYKDAFAAEVRAVARLDHPAIVTVYDHGVLDGDLQGEEDTLVAAAGSPWLAMARVDGPTLSQRRGLLRWEELGPLLLGLLDGLAHAHARGVLHRDLKPGNVMLGAHGPVLVDFGLAHPLDGPPDASRAGEIIGTAAYMAPEQFDGRDRAYGPWTDLYALGCTAWSAACGEPPFGLTDPFDALRRCHQSRALPAFRPAFPLPPAFREWLGWLLEKDPLQRPDHAAKAAAALRRLVPEPTSGTIGAPPQLPALPGSGLGLFGLRPVPLVDRGAERQALAEALGAVTAGEGGRVVALQGPPGCGKSRLADWLCEDSMERGVASVLRVEHDREGGERHGLRAALVRQLGVQGLSGVQRDQQLVERLRRWGLPPWAEGAAATADTLRRLVSEEAGFRTATERHQAWTRVLRLITQQGPLILRIEDGQWGADTLALLLYLRVHAPRLPILVLLTAREVPAGSSEAELLDRLLAERDAYRIDIGPLPPGWRRQLVQQVLGVEGRLAERVLERTGGHPLFVVQLLEDWVGRGLLAPTRDGFRLVPSADPDLPLDLHEVWQGRLHRALAGRSPPELRAVGVAAALGTRVDRQEWAAACRLMGAWASRALEDDLVRAGLVAPDRHGSAGFAFVHGLLRDSLLRALRMEGEEQVHAACAAMLAERYPSGPEKSAAQLRLGRHRLGAGQVEAALDPLAEGAWQCVRDSDYLAAEQALQEWEGALALVDLLPDDRRAPEGFVRAARIARRRGRPEAARRWALRARDCAGSHDDLLAEALRELARVDDTPDDAIVLLSQAVAITTRAGGVELLAWCQRDLGLRLLDQSGAEERAADLLRAAATAFATTGEVYGRATCLLGLARLDRARRADLLVDAARGFAESTGRQEPAHARTGLGDVAMLADRPSEARRLYQSALMRLRDIDNPDTRAAQAGLDQALQALGVSSKNEPRGDEAETARLAWVDEAADEWVWNAGD